ncbi:MAG: hypothetical protein NTW51_10570 [Cyanobacteria bacterium]|nr:hypothetical protein [Cyanobacteriota bacterium]
MTGALNTRPKMALRLLTWQSPSLPLGAWIAVAAAGGSALSAGGTALALRDPGPGVRRRVRREPEREEPWEGSAGFPWGRPWSDERPESASRRAGSDQRSRNAGANGNENLREIEQPQAWRQAASAGPDRAPGEPPPTLSVPYRVIRRGRAESPYEPMSSEAAGRQARNDRGGWSRQGEQGHSADPVPASDDWGSDTLEDW